MTDIWHNLQEQYQLSDEQVKMLSQYYHEMVTWNQYVNLTAITDPSNVVAYHFADALEVSKRYTIGQCTEVIDVGTGAGIPGIPLKIMFPHLHVVLIEVVQKKIQFLEHVIRKLGLQRIQISDYDWRTFVRKTSYDADVVTARASLQPDELIRMFKPSSAYHNATCIYWAAEHWEPSKKVAPYIYQDVAYTVADRARRYIFLSQRTL